MRKKSFEILWGQPPPQNPPTFPPEMKMMVKQYHYNFTCFTRKILPVQIPGALGSFVGLLSLKGCLCLNVIVITWPREGLWGFCKVREHQSDLRGSACPSAPFWAGAQACGDVVCPQVFSDVSSNPLSNDKGISQWISEVAALVARSERGLNTNSPTWL